MPTRFAQNDPRIPPPPYEVGGQPHYQGGGRHSDEAGELSPDQTIPKSNAATSGEQQGTSWQAGISSASLPVDRSNGGGNNKNNQLQIQAQHYNKHHSCVRPGRKSHEAGYNNQQRALFTAGTQSRSQLIESLSAPTRWFNSITIEPVAFLAIMALSIEFPSIQDLIYTKICLQVVGTSSNQTASSTTPMISAAITTPPVIASATRSSNNYSDSHPVDSLETTWIDLSRANSISFLTEVQSNSTTSLPSQGRIQQPTASQQEINNSPIFRHENHPTGGASQSNNSMVYLLCDELNKTAVPLEIRRKIEAGFSSFWIRYNLVMSVLCTLSTPHWGGISDKVGRLIPLNVPIVVSVISNLISLIFGLLIILNLHNLFYVDWLYLGAALVGLSGGQSNIIVNLFSFISDNTSSVGRSKRVVILESVIFLSRSIGFHISKKITSLGLGSIERPWLNRHFVASLTCVCLNLTCVLYSIIKLRHLKYHRFLNNFEREQQEIFAGDMMTGGNPIFGRVVLNSKSPTQDTANVNDLYEGNGGGSGGGRGKSNIADRSLRELTSSTPDDLDGPIARADRSWPSWATIFTFNYYKQTYATATKRREARSLIQMLLLCGFISSMSLATLLSLLFIYLHTEPFNWTTSAYSSWNSTSSITRGIALVALSFSMKFVKNWNVPDPLVAALGFLSKGSGLLMIGLANSSTIIDWAILALLFAEFSMPPIRSLLSKLVVREEVGKVYSCLAAIQNVCFLVGNIVFYCAYNYVGPQNFSRLSFLVVACFQFIAFIIMLVIYNILRRRVMII